MLDTKALAAALLDTVRKWVEPALKGLAGRVLIIEGQIKEIPVGRDGKDGKDGVDGKDADPAAVLALVREAVAALPPARDGEPGRDGKDADQEAIVSAVVARIPVPKDGRDGRDGESVSPETVALLVRAAVAEMPPPAPGRDGKDGLDGKDADPAVIRAAVREAVEALPAPKDGRDGKDADPEHVRTLVREAVEAIPKPQDGKDGAAGKDADQELIARLVAEGVEKALPVAVQKALDALTPDLIAKVAAAVPRPRDGIDGKDGRDGRDGKDGAAGRDGAEIQPVPAIDPAKSYPQGTWAKHAGGLWVTRAQTDGMTGWDCIVNGLDVITVIPGQDLRSLSLSTRCSNGAVAEKTVSVPTMIYRGVWNSEELYHRGDSTTYGGSGWVLMADEATGKPGDDGSGWQLSVKRGRDGKDGAKGEKGDRGPDGRPGKDLTQLGPDGRRW